MTVSAREGIAYIELIIYSPAIILAFYTNIRHGFVRQLGWFYLVIFCAIRIASAAMEIVSARNLQNMTNFIWAAILSVVGLSPLLLASLGLVKRVRDIVTVEPLGLSVPQLLHLPCLVALVLSIWGGVRFSSDSDSTRDDGTIMVKAGIFIFLAVFIGLFIVTVITLPKLSKLPQGEKPILLAVTAALPFLLVRILFSVLADFLMNGVFSVLYGNAYVYLGMVVLEEFAIVIMYLVAGIIAPPGSEMAGRISKSLHSRESSDPETLQNVPASQPVDESSETKAQ
ncbi:Forkhead transcription factor [Lecanora helva]